MMSEDRLAGVHAFVQAVEAGNFAKAATRMGQSRSAIAKSIARLEARLGVRLFHRTTRTQSLTEDGHGFYEHCKRALDSLTAAEATLAAGKKDAVGRLRVTAPLAFGRACVAPVLAALLGTHARLDLDLALGDRVVDLVAEGFDLAVRIGDLPDSSALAARTLGRQRLAYYASPAYLARHAGGTHAAIAYSARGASESWLFEHDDGSIGNLDASVRFRLDDVAAICDAARSGLGVARLPRWLAHPRVAAGELVHLGNSPPGPHAAVQVVWPAARALPMRTRVAIDALVAAAPALLDA